jgi:enoyl-[acyl-carrier protein] reductase II
MLGIRYPILLGGMAHVSRAQLVAAVSEAGGLGVIGSGGMPPELLVTQIAEVREKTNCPFGVNLMLMDPNIDEQVEIVIRERVPMVTTGAGNPAKYIDRLKEAGIKVCYIDSGDRCRGDRRWPWARCGYRTRSGRSSDGNPLPRFCRSSGAR